jgi:hypothetical protein
MAKLEESVLVHAVTPNGEPVDVNIVYDAVQPVWDRIAGTLTFRSLANPDGYAYRTQNQE